jgi:eukaryotic-like serine/threonine-protein kinase
MHPDREAGPLAVGQMLDEKYRIDELLEVGGMGAVYVGSHTRLQKRVAIKVLRSELTGAAEIVERFLREAVAASRIGHENIVEVTDIGKAQNGAPFIVMELLEGENLAARIRRGGPLSVPQACAIAIEILSAMDAAHRAGIVHRDLKPENVFLARKSRSETVKVLDFGISRMVETEEGQHRLTLTGLVMGTPYYMSPEQACGESDITAAADIYATGVMLYEMLTAKVPFEATNYNSLIYKVLSGQFPPPRALVAMPEPLEQIVVRAMALKAEHRFSSALEMMEALEPFIPPSAPSQPFQLVHWSPSPAAGFRPASVGAAGASAGFAAAAGVATARGAPREEAYASTLADTSPSQSGSLGALGAPDRQAAAEVMPAPVEAAPRRRGRMIAAIAAVVVLGGAGAALALLHRSQGGEAAATAAAGTSGSAATPAAPSPTAATPAASPTQTPAQTPVQTPAQTPAQTPSAPEHPAAASGAEPVTLSFIVTPPDAVITADGKAIEGHRLTAPRSSPEVVIEVVREGYASKQRTIAFDSDREIEIVLERAPPTRRPARAARRPARPDKRPPDKRIITDSPYD